MAYYGIIASNKFKLLKNNTFGIPSVKSRVRYFNRKRLAMKAIEEFYQRYPNCTCWRLKVCKLGEKLDDFRIKTIKYSQPK